MKKNTEYNLFLDDIRHPMDVYKFSKNKIYKNNDWLKVKDFEQFTNVIENLGLPKMISFDHDLASEHYELTCIKKNEKTGVDCANWLIEYCNKNKLNLPKEIFIHSMNPVGRQNILNIFNKNCIGRQGG